MASEATQALPETTANDRRAFAVLLILSLGLKSLVAWFLPLGVDEAYAIAVAREFSISFFDHPPIAFWMPTLSAQVFGMETPFVYRLPFLITGAVTSWLMYLIGREIGGGRAGVPTLLLYLASPFFLISGGVLVVPDGPLGLFSALTVLLLVKLLHAKAPPLWMWLLTGGALALALASKYQAAWLPVGLLLFLLVQPSQRRRLATPGPWLGALVGGLGLVPVLYWNAQTGWASFGYHSARASGGFYPQTFALMLAGQALLLLPSVLWAALAGLWQMRAAKPAGPLLAILALGPILIFNAIYLVSKSSQAHWPMPGWQFLLPLGALWLTQLSGWRLGRFLRWLALQLVVIWVLLLALLVHVNTGALTRPFYASPPRWDRSLDLFDYGGLKEALMARGLWDQTDLLMTPGWARAGLIDTATHGEKPMQVLGGCGAHHFRFLTDATRTGRALYLEPVLPFERKRREIKRLQTLKSTYPDAHVLPAIWLKRGSENYAEVVVIQFTTNTPPPPGCHK